MVLSWDTVASRIEEQGWQLVEKTIWEDLTSTWLCVKKSIDL